MRFSTDFRNWGFSYTRLGNRSILAALRVNRILVMGPFAFGFWL